MQPHQLRAVDEADALATKIVALDGFLKGPVFRQLDVAERDRLRRQYGLMGQYLAVLHERIAAFQ
ncbi:crAss001_48 related protein [Burkholderia ubonensis]|uniref:crAss001_48 related protein n=1 Tax=Burkholderia ubonensis TaxID=101571 RepID=UPI0008FDF4EB|nr:hypothetical protein [Burkholderia ubonensis]OJA27803.1 hypothetical protein BGX87_20760 [Burkholderia ubonensis]